MAARKRIDHDDTGVGAATGAAEAMAALRNVGLPLIVTDLENDRIVAVNDAAVELFAIPSETLVGRSPIDLVQPDGRATAKLALDLVRDGRLNGYSARRLYSPAHGTTFDAEVWVRRFDVHASPPLALIVLVPHDSSEYKLTMIPVTAGGAMTSVIAVTDHDWIVRYASADAKAVLGISARDLIGSALLGIVHPGDAPDFLFAVAEATASERAVVCRVRVRVKGRHWRYTTCNISLLCDHSPPRLGILATSAAHDEPPPPGWAEPLDAVFTRIALKTRAAAFVPQVPELLDQATADQMAQLTSRQWEIITRLGRGESPTKIAAAMFVSPSTVRNQLSALYRKFGVHSQVELLSHVRASLPAPNQQAGPAQNK